MQIRNDECEELRVLYRQHENLELTVDEARDVLLRLTILVERFAEWTSKQRDGGSQMRDNSLS